jgi:hypothetical protein
MPFNSSVVQEAWRRSGSECECRMTIHKHLYVRCNNQLVWENRGKIGKHGCWEAHHIVAGGTDTVSNCEILCSSF